jgi:hypothetical protein
MPHTMRAMMYATVVPQALYLMGMCWLLSGYYAVSKDSK